MKGILRDTQRIIITIAGLIGIYGILLFTLGFNYINSFITATAAETTQGWELITNPFEYFTSRIKNIMDILMFFGPVLIVLFYLFIGFALILNLIYLFIEIKSIILYMDFIMMYIIIVAQAFILIFVVTLFKSHKIFIFLRVHLV